MNNERTPAEVRLTAGLGPTAPEREAYARWVSASNSRALRILDADGAHAAGYSAGRAKALQDAARWVDEEVGHAVQDGWSVEAVQALMATRDMLKAHAEMMATAIAAPGA
jgi:hypothetical protein